MPTPATAPAAPTEAPALACPHCRQPMQRLALVGHYGRPVEIDLCPPCHALWFDPMEGSRLDGASMLALLGRMAEAQATPHRPASPRPACPHCAATLHPVRNRSRFGQAEQLECPQRHGTGTSFGQWLSERGLVRTLTPADRAAFAASQAAGRPWLCVNCGGPLQETGPDSRCRWCASLAGVLDIARMASALDPEGATEAMPVHRAGRQAHTYACHACGHSAGGLEGLACPACGATLIAADLAAAHRQLAALAGPLQAHRSRPAPHVRERRLKALQADLERRRQTVRDLEAGTARHGGHGPFGGAGGSDDEDALPAARVGRWGVFVLLRVVEHWMQDRGWPLWLRGLAWFALVLLGVAVLRWQLRGGG